ncbi:hypothetical protein MKX08_000691 [Trichoderma sp. CBMAI-0020]|nr:hypothetical protein MKX08_000691 [Trichoderma sp. CBMAI-0020]
MDTEHTSEIKSEDEREIQHPTIEYDIPAVALPIEERFVEETTSGPIELPYWKPDDRDNVITHAIYRQLIKRYVEEHETWDSQMRSDMLVESKTLDYRIFNSRGAMHSHILHKRMKQKVTWPRFWTLRVMFGPAACARQTWFPEVLKRFPDFASKSAYTGVVPPNIEEVLGLDEWVPPAPSLEECGRPRVTNRTAASIGIRRFRRQKEGTNGGSNTSAMTAAAATASPIPVYTTLRSLETNSTEQSVETPAAMRRQSMIAPDFGTNEMPPPRDNGESRSKFRPFEEVQSSQMNHLDMQNQVRELGDENIYLRQINAIQQRLIEQYQERILRLEAESRVMRGRG